MGRSSRAYYGWTNVVLASLAMTATLPGRTHGLGLITKPLLEDLAISESTFANINLLSTLAGAVFALPMGILLDKFGTRLVGTLVVAALSVCVFQLTSVTGQVDLFAWLTLIRGLGQSALSVIAMAIISKWFGGKRLAAAMGMFAVLLTFGFVASVLGMGWAIDHYGWRAAWKILGWSLVGLSIAIWLLVRNSPEPNNVESNNAETTGTNYRSESTEGATSDTEPTVNDITLMDALRTPAFWIVALATSVFNLVWSSITLFNESILSELGFDQKASVEMMAYLTGLGLVSNLIAGKLATRERTGMLLSVSMLALAGALACFPFIQTINQLRAYGATMGFVGGIITVVHFSVWGQFFGRAEIGRIQGAAQVMTVLASAMGPTFVAWYADNRHSHLPVYFGFAGLSLTMALAAALVKAPVDHRKSALGFDR